MHELVVITCSVNRSVNLGDINVLLSGRGSSARVLRSTAEASEDLKKAVRSRFVKVVMVPRPSASFVPPQRMPIWPFSRPAEKPEDPLLRVMKSIDSKLGELLLRPTAPPPEVVAAHVRAMSSHLTVPAGLPGGGHAPGPGSSSLPQFIPSQIVPDSKGGNIKVKTGESDSSSISDASAALKNLRKNR